MYRFILAVIGLLSLGELHSQTALQTSFESSEGYTTGNLSGQNGWSVTSGTATVVNTTAKTGTQAVQFSANNTALRADYVAYNGNIPGITGEVYMDMWVNPSSFVTRGLVINGYDLYGGSQKRIFVVEFTTDNKIKAYNGSTGSNVGVWVANQWVRVSVKIDFNAETYKVAIDGSVFAADFNFREVYTPTASGTRLANIKEFHSLRFNHSSDTQVATSDAAVDDIYVGTTAIPGVSFGASSNERTITVTQPQYGNISLSPATGPYILGQSVTATLTLPAGYMNNGWTGDLSGTALVNTFTVNANMAFSANVGIDPVNPPAKYKITVNAPSNGQINLSPLTVDSMYYAETVVTASVVMDACNLFNNWIGDLSGNQNPKSFTVQANMTIGADITPNNIPAVKRIVSSVTEFKNALSSMNPGDTVEVNNGPYNLGFVTITKGGCEDKPIIVIAKNQGQAILSGSTSLLLRNIKYVTIQGFSINSANVSTGIKLENCSKVRITKNHFSFTESSSCTWLYIGDTYASPEPLRSGYNRVDHNIFEGKTQPGNYIRLDGNINSQSQYDTIDHNYFRNNGPRATNEKESIRVGVSTLSMSSGFTLIEKNLFEDCDGDPEIISVKSCDNTIRYNTFVRSLGTLSLRHGFRNIVEGNYFFGEGKTAWFNGGTIGCGGIRVYGKDHAIINNYFHGLTGEKWDAAITITNGNVNNNSTSLTEHFVPENVLVAFNTLYNNHSNIEIGFTNNGNYSLAPINCSLVNNIVVDSINPIIKYYSSTSLAGVNFLNNIMYPTSTSSIGITATPSQVSIVDPMLSVTACTDQGTPCNETYAYKVLRLNTGSVAIDAAVSNFPMVTKDFEGQSRSSNKDIGAHEYNGNRTIHTGALDSSHVGPYAIDYHYAYYYPALPVNLVSFNVILHNQNAILSWEVMSEVNLRSYVIEVSKDGKAFEALAVVEARGSSTYQYIHGPVPVGKLYFRLRNMDNDGRFTYSMIRMVYNPFNMKVAIYPNPATDYLAISLSTSNSEKTELRLINSVGAVVRKLEGKFNGMYQMQVNSLPAGVYYLRVSQKGYSITQKVIITK